MMRKIKNHWLGIINTNREKKMKYGQLAKNRKINDTIYRCFEYISEEDARKFVKKFSEQPHEDSQILHTFRELVLGAFLASNGFNISHEHMIDSKKPDWSILDSESELQCIIELTNFHIDRVTEDAIKKKTESGDFWCGWINSNNHRLYQHIQKKSETYEEIARKNNIPYVVAVFGEFMAFVEFKEINECLFKDYYGGLFKQYMILSGVLFFQEFSGKYIFKYIPNPNSDEPANLPSGEF